MARPRKETAAQLRERIERYFERRQAEGRFPTEAGMLLELGLSEAGRATGCMNALKQEKNGGYADKAGAGAEKRLVIRLEGVGSGAAE